MSNKLSSFLATFTLYEIISIIIAAILPFIIGACLHYFSFVINFDDISKDIIAKVTTESVKEGGDIYVVISSAVNDVIADIKSNYALSLNIIYVIVALIPSVLWCLLMYTFRSHKVLTDEVGGLSSNVISASSDLSSKFADISNDMSSILNSMDKKLEIVVPGEPQAYKKIYSGAKNIYAYNPPLSLLVDDDSTFRQLIFENLKMSDAKFEIIHGDSAVDNIKKLKDLIAKEQPENQDLFKKIKFQHYQGKIPENMSELHDAPRDLHSTVCEWKLNVDIDYRGVSFFLVESGLEKKVLLYLWGQPLSPKFTAPNNAILVTSHGNQHHDFYDKYYSLFKDRWDELDG